MKTKMKKKLICGVMILFFICSVVNLSSIELSNASIFQNQASESSKSNSAIHKHAKKKNVKTSKIEKTASTSSPSDKSIDSQKGNSPSNATSNSDINDVGTVSKISSQDTDSAQLQQSQSGESANKSNTQNIEVNHESSGPVVASSQPQADTLSIPSAGINVTFAYGDTQESIDANDVCIFPSRSYPGNGSPILMAGHRTRSLRTLYYTTIGDVITVYMSYGTYQYQVFYSAECTTDDYDFYDLYSGEPLLESSGEVLQIYTCYGSNNHRWLVKANRI